MDYLINGTYKAVLLLINGSGETYSAIWATLKVSTLSISFSLIIGMPIGFILAGYNFPAQSEVEPVNTFDTGVEAYTPHEAAKEGKRAVDMLVDKYPKGLTDVSISSSVSYVRIMNTSGLDMEYRFSC